MAKVLGLESLLSKLKAKEQKAKQDQGSVVVGYQAAYALFVHENRAMKWKGYPRDQSVRLDKDGVARYGHTPTSKKRGVFWGPAGRAGFLLDVFREMIWELRSIILAGMRRDLSLLASLYRAGLRLQRESQKNVPVDTGNLRASAFTEIDR